MNEDAGCECCFIQLRMICELIGLSCLLAHSDIPETKTRSNRRLERPSDILKLLGELHEDFFPRAVRFVNKERDPVPLSDLDNAGYEYIEERSLSSLDLLDLYGLCGDMVHNGTLERAVGTEKFKSMDNVIEWTDRLHTLLKNHEIRLIHPDYVIWASLGEDHQKVEAFLMSTRPPQ
ncbi:MAG: hypothetical protein K0U72_04910 [Gammaproteobacteria bacterium]|nr:hypothetical protein [Gammaproteobacteria bacterium]